MKLFIAALAMILSAQAFAANCYQSPSDKDLQVCLEDYNDDSIGGDGYTIIQGRGITNNFVWTRTGEGTFALEKKEHSEEFNGCQSKIKVESGVLTISEQKDLDRSGCALLVGDYTLVSP